MPPLNMHRLTIFVEHAITTPAYAMTAKSMKGLIHDPVLNKIQ